MPLATMDIAVKKLIDDHPELKDGLLSTPGFFERALLRYFQYMNELNEKYRSAESEQDRKRILSEFSQLQEQDMLRLLDKYEVEARVLLPSKDPSDLRSWQILLVIEGLQNEYRSFYNSSEPCKNKPRPSYADALPEDWVPRGKKLIEICIHGRYIIFNKSIGPNENPAAYYIPLDERVKPQSERWSFPTYAAKEATTYFEKVCKNPVLFLKKYTVSAYYAPRNLKGQYAAWAPWPLAPFPLDIRTSDSPSPDIPFVLSRPRISVWNASRTGKTPSKKFYINGLPQNPGIEMSNKIQEEAQTSHRAKRPQLSSAPIPAARTQNADIEMSGEVHEEAQTSHRAKRTRLPSARISAARTQNADVGTSGEIHEEAQTSHRARRTPLPSAPIPAARAQTSHRAQGTRRPSAPIPAALEQNADIEMSDEIQEEAQASQLATGTHLTSAPIPTALAQGLQSVANHSSPFSQASAGTFPSASPSTIQPQSLAPPMLATPQGASQPVNQNPLYNLPTPGQLDQAPKAFAVTSWMIDERVLDQSWLDAYNANTSVNLNQDFKRRGGLQPKKTATTNADMDGRCPAGLDIRVWQEACSLEKDEGIIRSPELQYTLLVARSVAYAKIRLQHLGFLDANERPTLSDITYTPSRIVSLKSLDNTPPAPTGVNEDQWKNALKNYKECIRFPHRNNGGHVAKYIEVMLTPGAFALGAETKIQPS